MAPPKKPGGKKPIGIDPKTGTTAFGGKTTKPVAPTRPTGSNNFDNPLNNRDGKPKPIKPPSSFMGGTGNWIKDTFQKPAGNGAASPAKPAAGPKPPAKTAAGAPAAARAVVAGSKKVGAAAGAAAGAITFGKSGGNKSASSPASSSSAGSRPAPASPARSGGKASPAKTQNARVPKKPGNVYAKTRSSYKSEAANQPKSYETDDQRKARMDKSKFDWSMSASDVKKYRKEYLKKHPAAAKAVANGTMSMGDINLTVRRLKKKGSMGAFGMKQENAG